MNYGLLKNKEDWKPTICILLFDSPWFNTDADCIFYLNLVSESNNFAPFIVVIFERTEPLLLFRILE